MSHSHDHKTHPAITKRLNRAAGHLRSIVEMIENGRSCVEVAIQMQAVERAVVSAKRTFIQDHLSGCIAEDSTGKAEAMEEFKAIAKYL